MIENSNLISVVIPMYNAEKTIKKTIKSVLEQTSIADISEIIIIDDGSQDNSRTIVSELQKKNPKIRLISQKNGGVSNARNHGIRESKSKWIAFLDSDDCWVKNKIEVQLNYIKQNPKIDFIGGNHDVNKISFFLKPISYFHRVSHKELCFKQFCQTPTWIVKKEIIDSIGCFDENQKYGEDLNVLLRLSTKFNCYFINDKLSYNIENKHIFGDKGLSSNIKKMHQGFLKNYKQLYDMGCLSKTFYFSTIAWEYIKYLRRIFIMIMIKAKK